MTSGRHPQWIRGPIVDSLVAWAWVPFFGAAALFPDRAGLILAGAFVLSFAHQPLTLALVYGDPRRFSVRPGVFTVSPVVFVAAVVIGMQVSVTLVAVIAGLWNAEHTLMQRYGVTRIYARKGGRGGEGGALERAMLFSWLTLAVVWAAADPRTPEHLRSVTLGTVNTNTVETLASLRPFAAVLLWPVVATAAGLTLRWLVLRRRRGSGTRAQHAYVLATASLFAAILVQPIWGLAGFIGSHAIEYFAVVEHAIARDRAGGSAAGALGRAVRRLGSRGFLVAYLLVVLVPYTLLRVGDQQAVLTYFVLMAGGLHVFYDGFIWKLRRPEIARSLGATAAPAAAAS